MELRGARLGSLVGAVAGLVFVLVNAGGLPGSLVVRLLAVAAFVVALVLIVRDRRPTPEPASTALRTYLVCVVGEVVAIPVGAAVLNAVDRPDLVVCWVVLVVGVHFLPFARAFRAPVFVPLGVVLVLTAAVCGAAVLAGADDADLVAGVVAGFVLIGFVAHASRAPRSTPE